MAKSVTYGPNGTPVDGVTAVTFAVPPLNYDADFRLVEDEPGRVLMTDLTSPQDQPSTLRITQTSRANIYAGTSIDPSVFLASRRGLDTYLEVREIWSESDSEDSTYLRHVPVRFAISMTLPESAIVTPAAVERLAARAVAALFAQGDATIDDGVSALLHGVVRK